MTCQYEEVVPWGRSFDEYRRMFNLKDKELSLKIIGCADGPASFNAYMAQRGHRMISCDPLYQFTAAQIDRRIDYAYRTVLAQTRANLSQFIWDVIRSPEELGEIRLKAMREFLADYEAGKKEGRYVAAELPALPFPAVSFDLALCSHFLFLYTDNLSLAFHEQAIAGMCRVAREVRIFPLITYNAERSPFVEALIPTLEQAGHRVAVERVPYEFQRGAGEMMRIW
ncbi:hypothetical protein ANRL4_03515 [Anaerolineae bacterium]|nr:hypothetical protein ANRL4_03515 [Anaerolineae bacterium]